MLKIIRCNDPFFSVRDMKNRFYWNSDKRDENLHALISQVRKGRSVVLPWAEQLFVDNVAALNFLEAIKESDAEVTFYCRKLDLPDILLEFALIEEDNQGYDALTPIIDKLSFSDYTKNIVKENLKGFPFSKIEKVLDEMTQMTEEKAVEFFLDNKRDLLAQNSVLEVVKIDGSLDDIGGLQDLKTWIVERRNNFSKEALDFGIPMPKGILLLGVQGCGKSLTSKIIANIWNFPLVRLDFVNLFKQGKSVEELLKEAITIVEGCAPVVLWIDEMEKALSQESQSVEIRRVLGWLMTWMQEKTEPVFLVATANQVDLLPPELLRKGRFDEIFFVDLPAKPEREEIFDIHITKRNRDVKNYNVPRLAKDAENFSGAEIEQIVIDSLIADYSKNQDLSQKTLEEVLRRTVPLAVTYEENIKKLRLWARSRARNASGNKKIESYFS